MTERIDIYPYELKVNGAVNILFWINGKGKSKDHFAKDSKGKIAVAKTSDDVAELFSAQRTLIHWNESACFDAKQFFGIVNRVHAGKILSTPRCNYLLNGWNFLEDCARSVGVANPAENHRTLSNFYKKLVYGSNLPALTPEKRSYHPVPVFAEVRDFRVIMKELWDAVLASAPEISS